MRALDRKLLRDAVHLRGQMAAVGLVVISGIALFVTLRSMHGYLVGAQQRYYDEYRFAQVFAHLKAAPDLVAEKIAAIPRVAAVQTRIVADVLLDVPGLAEPATGRLISIPEMRRPMLNDLHLRRGRFPDPGSRDEVVASDAFTRANGLGPGDHIGAVIHGHWQRLRIAGTAISPEFVYEIRGAGEVFPDNRRFGVLWMGHDALASAFDLQGSFNDVALTLSPGAVEPDIIVRLDHLLEPFGGLGAYGREDHVSHRFVSDEIMETQVSSILIPSIFLGVTAFMLHLVLSRLIGLQRDQIAVLKAFGYRGRTVAAHYLALALMPVLAGVIAGSALGLYFASALAGVYARFYQFPTVGFRPDPWVVAAGALVGLGTGLAGGLGAMRRAMALAPAEAMRPEAPTRFRPGLIERIGIRRLLSPAARIVVRDLDRRPVKAALSVLGIALAVAIIVTGRYIYDAVDRMKQVQFEHIQREDVAVTFRDPRSASIQHELSRLPGVLRVEPFRAVGARLRSVRHGHLEHRNAVLGLDPDGQLRRIVDRDFRPHRPPPDGMILTDTLARLLQVRPGDWIAVEVLEGARPIAEVRVTGVVHELIGSSAYMDLGSLHRLLREGDVLSGAFLAVDPPAAPDLYARLKRLPAIGGVAVRSAVRRAFETTIAESFMISIVVTIAFACIIAFGMVYNGARIALSERGRQLASLRVLGFSRREVAGMLLGEQAVLTVAAIPTGFAIGYGLCALIAWRFESELFRVPLVISGATLAFATIVVAAAAALSGLAVRRRIDRLDLVEVLKTRE